MDKIPPPNYIKGEEFTEILKEVTGCKTLLEMSELFGVPKATFSAWNTHNRTSHELMVRLHLAKGIPIEKMALGIEPDSQSSMSKDFISEVNAGYGVTEPDQSNNPQHQTVILSSFCLSNGRLIKTGEVPYALRRMNSFGLTPENTIELETNEGVYLVDSHSKDAVSGDYLIDIDGRLSINHIQRLPGNKLAIAFRGNTMEVSEYDIKVIGRVAVTLQKQ